ncbi:alkaline phosphatase D family protein [Marinobacter sp. JSM 1782161]|uniref:alkaline phosphatase D family protein n=1 Tax=Marinobacter sp. JSM 1782161 TaxID=2685906 RepID=UPI001401D592|nr:alkaline phosphatase D family protein [Marinobacter sp. JSM 1782161]
MKRLTRREFLRVSALSAGAVVVSTGLAGCLSSGGSSSDSGDDGGDSNGSAAFQHGVASGDPLQDRVLLWTRVTPLETDGAVSVGWEVATDASFANLVHSGSTETNAGRDYTVKVDVLSLSPGETYYYRFKSQGSTSLIGQTRTLPEGSVSQVTLAVMSCANYPAGYFNVYDAVAQESDLDAVVHLGDYLYEYANGQYGTDEVRQIPDANDTELLALEDYRSRYALYRTDSNLQVLHAQVPFIAVWDDHEVANDAWESGAQNHQGSEGDYSERKLAALQAYFEWMPVRPASEDDEETIYRSFAFGDLVSLYMLDTRLIARDEQLDYDDYMSGDIIDREAVNTARRNTNREMLGAEQLAWLSNQVQTSTATWQVLGQQVLMGRMLFPEEVIVSYQNGDSAAVISQLTELLVLKEIENSGGSLTTDQQARLDNTLPYNLDAWDGYVWERDEIFQLMADNGKNLVVLAGDTHNAWANNLTLDDPDGDVVGVEFATASVSSPGLEYYLGLSASEAATAAQGLETLIDGLEYANVSQRGYLRVTFTATEARADWRFVSTATDTSYSLDSDSAYARRTVAGAPGLTSV